MICFVTFNKYTNIHVVCKWNDLTCKLVSMVMKTNSYNSVFV